MKRYLSLILAFVMVIVMTAVPGYAGEMTDEAAAVQEVAEQPAAPAEEPANEEQPAEASAAESATEDPPAAPKQEPVQAAEPEPAPVPEEPVGEPASEPVAVHPAGEVPSEPVTEEEPAEEPVREEEPALVPAAEEAPADPSGGETSPAEPMDESPAVESAQEESVQEESTQKEPTREESVAEEAPADPSGGETPAAEPMAEAPAALPVQEESVPEEPAQEKPVNQPDTPAEEGDPAGETEPAVTGETETQLEEQAALETPPVSEAAEELETPVEPVPEAETPIDDFRMGLARLSAGDVFVDPKCREMAGHLTAQSIAYVTERISGEGVPDKKDIVKVIVNVDGTVRSFYVRYGRLTLLSEAEQQQFVRGKHDGAVEYKGVLLEPAAFMPIEAGEPEIVPEQPAVEETPEAPKPTEKESGDQPVQPMIPETILFEETETTDAEPEKAAVAPTVNVPSVIITPSLSVQASTTIDYDYVTNGSLNITWSAANGNGKYNVKVILLNSAPSYTAAATNVVATLLNETDTARTSLTLTAADMQKAKYMKVWIQAQDAHYEENQGTRQIAFGIHFTPKAQVSVSVSATPSLTITPKTIMEYDATTNGDLTLKWSAAHGNGKYTVKALLINNKPSFTAAASGIVKTLLSQTAGTETSLKITAAEMKTAKYMKIMIQAQDAHYEQNGKTSSIQFALQLKPDPVVSVSVSTSPALSVEPRTVIDYDQAVKGALTLQWSSTNGNGKYNVKAVLTNNVPTFGAPTKGVVKTAVSLTGTTSTSVTIPLSYLKLGKYMKVVISAQDVNYERNGATATVEYGIHFTPTPMVAAPTVSSVPQLSLAAKTIVDYRIGDGDLMLKWSAAGGNGTYSYVVAIAKNQPVFGKATTGVVKKLTGDNVNATSLKISADDLALGKFVKVLITAQDENYLQNGKKESIEFAIRLIPVFTIETVGSGTARIVSYNGSAEEVTVPSTIDGNKIIEIGASAFKGNGLKKVTLPNTVRKIGISAFENCASLTTVILSDNVEDIGDAAFNNCPSLVMMLVHN